MRWRCKWTPRQSSASSAGQSETLGLSLRTAVWGKRIILRKVQSGDHIADICAKELDPDTIQKHVDVSDLTAESGSSGSANRPPYQHPR